VSALARRVPVAHTTTDTTGTVLTSVTGPAVSRQPELYRQPQRKRRNHFVYGTSNNNAVLISG
jgi:hypothetical protein